MTISRQRLARAALGLAVLALLIAFARSVDWRSAASAMRGADLRLAGLALVLNLLSLALKGARWWVFLQPLGRVSLALVMRATFAGASLNNLVVAQGGEGARVLLVARAARISSAGVLAALAVERALDVLCYLLLLVGAVWLLQLPPQLARWRVPAAAVLFLGTGAFVALALHSPRRAPAAGSPRPPSVGDRVLGYLGRVREDAALVASPARLGAGLMLSLGAWALQVATYHLGALAVQLSIPLRASVAAQLAVGASFLIRATPGNVGVFQVIYALALGRFGIAEGPAVAAALLIQTLQVVPTVALGTLAAPGLLRGTAAETG